MRDERHGTHCGQSRSDALTGAIGGRRAWGVDGVDDFGVVDALEMIDVTPRLLGPSWR
jgi:hypothetical protein